MPCSAACRPEVQPCGAACRPAHPEVRPGNLRALLEPALLAPTSSCSSCRLEAHPLLLGFAAVPVGGCPSVCKARACLPHASPPAGSAPTAVAPLPCASLVDSGPAAACYFGGGYTPLLEHMLDALGRRVAGGAPSPQQQPHMQQPQPPPPIRPHRRNHSLRSNGVTTAPSTPTVSAAVPPQHPFAQGTPFSCRPPTPQSPPTQQPQAACAAPPPACLPCLRCTSCGRAFGTAPAYVPASPPAAATLPPNHAHLASFAERCAQASTATAANALRGRVAPVCHGGPHAVLQGGAACALIPEPCSSADRAAHGSSGGSNGSSGGSGHGSGGGGHGSGGAAVMERSVKDQQHLSWSAAAEGLSSAYSMPHLDQDGAQAAAMGASALGGPIEGRGQARGGASGGGRALRHMLRCWGACVRMSVCMCVCVCVCVCMHVCVLLCLGV